MAENKCIQCDSLKTELCTLCEKKFFCKEHTFWFKAGDMWEKENICLDCHLRICRFNKKVLFALICCILFFWYFK